MNQSSDLFNAFAKAVGLFIPTVLLGYWLDWDIVDISWSIWVTSFTVSVLAVCVEAVFMYWLLELSEVTPEQKASPDYKPSTTEGNIFSTLFMFGILMYLVVVVNLVVGLCLDAVVPIIDGKSDMQMSEIAVHALRNYWPFLFISLIKPCFFYYKIIVSKRYKEADTQTDLILAPYNYVFRNQAFTVILMALTFFSNQYLVYWVLLLFYFFPWLELWQWLKTIRPKSKDQTSES